MRIIGLIIPAILIACTGCTTVALNDYTRKQIQTSGDCRDQAVLNCLASVADDCNMLPSFALYSAGLASVTDSATLGYTGTWAPLKYTLEAIALTGSRSPKPQWTFDPAVEYEKLSAIHAACLWVVFGRECAVAKYEGILGKQEDYLDQKPHFAVEERLSRLPQPWLHRGSRKDVPDCVRYKAQRGDTWIWIMPCDHEAFAQFTLALQDIATLDTTSYYSPPPVIWLTTSYVTKVPDPTDSSKAMTIATTEYRAIKREFKEEVDKIILTSLVTGEPIKLTRAQWLEYTDLYTGTRSTSTGTPAANLSARTNVASPGASSPGQAPGSPRATPQSQSK